MRTAQCETGIEPFSFAAKILEGDTNMKHPGFKVKGTSEKHEGKKGRKRGRKASGKRSHKK
jgi:hypothetical protein